ncbi:PREDICTED: uncharacterized protein LOC108514129 isoform X5 [Rhinopithecus bieti]|uniref:uncharacterized protein LOC108514129 isoform X5 n=1 Tax=Rhinopithecus bieti TaxID=61621 RepID=UPI00083C5C5D|nr:PREDICTED: uncharacterized protein LOC108514129 isoform X5 [Rhinopithecus bieti]XP_017705678.1 PREDICTED: uncharacterized protein LOC108514129 isoform X5 [Rhinopithecus bieti]XP_017705679.1 PREDICTED: uncharacterized protein LOC108514129 isoform X5 [Rhinopithecus bieti]XP_017705680.1 PREDICTED: uncharacterized protein LOC108514129 isoform X5 [Rhinopithecus bieti]
MAARGRGLRAQIPGGVPAGRTRSSTDPAGHAPACRLPVPLAARCVAAGWLLRTEVRLVFLQRFPPRAVAEFLSAVVAALAAATVTTRDGGGCSRTCSISEIFQSFSDAVIDQDPQAALEDM